MNPGGGDRCASCGSWLTSEVGAARDDAETIIDVSGGQPRIVEPTAPAVEAEPNVWFSRGQMIYVRSGSRGCWVWGLIASLFICSQCVIAYVVLRWIF